MRVGDRVVVDPSNLQLWYPMEGRATWEPDSWAGEITWIGEPPEDGEWPAGREVEVTMDSPSPYDGPFYVYCYGFDSLTPEREQVAGS